MAKGYLVDIFGYHYAFDNPKEDQVTYLVTWAVVTLVLIAIATKYGGFAVGLAITAFLGVVVATRH